MNFTGLGLAILLYCLVFVIIFLNIPLLFLFFIFGTMLKMLKEKANDYYSIIYKSIKRFFQYFEIIFSSFVPITLVAGLIAYTMINSWHIKGNAHFNAASTLFSIGMIICVPISYFIHTSLLNKKISELDFDKYFKNTKKRNSYLICAVLSIITVYVVFKILGEVIVYSFIQMNELPFGYLEIFYGLTIYILSILTPSLIILTGGLSFSLFTKKIRKYYIKDNNFKYIKEKKKWSINLNGKYSIISFEGLFAIGCFCVIFYLGMQLIDKYPILIIAPELLILTIIFAVYYNLLREKNNYVSSNIPYNIKFHVKVENFMRFLLCMWSGVVTTHIVAINILCLSWLAKEWYFEVNFYRFPPPFDITTEAPLYFSGIFIMIIYSVLFFSFDKILADFDC